MDVHVLLNWILWTSMFYLDAHVFGNIVQSSNIHILQVPVLDADLFINNVKENGFEEKRMEDMAVTR